MVVPQAICLYFHMHNSRGARVFAGARLAALTCEHRPSMTGIEKKKKNRIKERFEEKKKKKKVDMLDNNSTGTPPTSHHAPVPSCHVMKKTRRKPREHV